MRGSSVQCRARSLRLATLRLGRKLVDEGDLAESEPDEQRAQGLPRRFARAFLQALVRPHLRLECVSRAFEELRGLLRAQVRADDLHLRGAQLHLGLHPRQHHLDAPPENAQRLRVQLAQIDPEVRHREDDRAAARRPHRVARPMDERGPGGRLLARIGREVDLLVERDVERLQPGHLTDLQDQGRRVGQARLAVREVPDDGRTEREREQQGGQGEQVAHRNSIPRGPRTISYLDLRKASFYGAPTCCGGLVSKRIALSFVVFAAACSSSDNNTLPSFVVPGSIVTKTYDGQTDDLLTAGLGTGGLGQVTSVSPTPPPPGFADPANPTAAELRKRAIYINYRALVDPTFNGGYSTLYGPNVDVNGNLTLGSGKIGGEEWLAYDDDGTGRANVTMMVQVPDSFDPNNPCIVTATSSGSRGVYGAIATAGEWGLKHGCAVAYTDKGSGMGVDDIQNNTVNLIDGTRTDAATAGTKSNYTANLSDSDRTAFNTATPNRFAVKHAHSQLNPEKDWGKYTLHAIEFAYYVLNQKFGTSQGSGAPTLRKY